MPSQWIMAAVGLALVFWVIPLLILGFVFFARSRRAAQAKVIWRSFRCPVKKTAVKVGVLQTENTLHDLKVMDTIYCTAMDDPCRIVCDKECLRLPDWNESLNVARVALG
ncbi:MAG: hypothetical protein RMM98_12715 [Acidobacteriota bacterium]|nr:hypothetical protein [Blastocatellia bacterium]MDW8240470.1 hypothetical protein [Acidobacteriota bacterium]